MISTVLYFYLLFFLQSAPGLMRPGSRPSTHLHPPPNPSLPVVLDSSNSLNLVDFFTQMNMLIFVTGHAHVGICHCGMRSRCINWRISCRYRNCYVQVSVRAVVVTSVKHLKMFTFLELHAFIRVAVTSILFQGHVIIEDLFSSTLVFVIRYCILVITWLHQIYTFYGHYVMYFTGDNWWVSGLCRPVALALSLSKQGPWDSAWYSAYAGFRCSRRMIKVTAASNRFKVLHFGLSASVRQIVFKLYQDKAMCLNHLVHAKKSKGCLILVLNDHIIFFSPMC